VVTTLFLGLLSNHTTADPTDDSLRACEAALRKAQLEGDVTALEQLIDDALHFTGPDGSVFWKADDLDAHREGWVRITRLGWRVVAGHASAVVV